MKETLRDLLLQNAVFLKLPFYYAIKGYCSEDVLRVKNKKWTVWLHDAPYQTGLNLHIFKEDCPVYFEPVEKQFFVCSKQEWTADEVKETFTDSFIDVLLHNVRANTKQGDVAIKGKNAEVTLWDFHNHQIYYQK